MSSTVVIYLTDTRIIASRVQGAGSAAVMAERRCVALDEPLDACAEFSVGAVSKALSDVARGMTTRSTAGTLVIPARWCYVHPIELGRRRFSTQTAAYELEEFLPLPLEQVTCGFVRNGDGTALGVAVPTLPN